MAADWHYRTVHADEEGLCIHFCRGRYRTWEKVGVYRHWETRRLSFAVVDPTELGGLGTVHQRAICRMRAKDDAS